MLSHGWKSRYRPTQKTDTIIVHGLSRSSQREFSFTQIFFEKYPKNSEYYKKLENNVYFH